jgi:hypothetical protein
VGKCRCSLWYSSSMGREECNVTSVTQSLGAFIALERGLDEANVTMTLTHEMSIYT